MKLRALRRWMTAVAVGVLILMIPAGMVGASEITARDAIKVVPVSTPY